MAFITPYAASAQSDNRHTFDVLEKKIDDLLWYEKVGDIAWIDKVFLAGPPKWREANPTGQGAGNPLKFWSYVFIPKDVDPNKKYPLIVMPHGGVHSNHSTYYAHIIRELMAQQYIVVAAEYRGSTGYGRGMYESIDYGGLENADVKVSRDYMVENYDIVDSKRIGL
ncbi:MAG: prolyl oligopeptidase family serine peptidase, partial [Bacteroidales bacterium]|nr:prolyl oligopeptidase family serine peptidase [Bacteroidales bacterium]